MVYQIHQYPADLIDVLHLPDAGRVVVRPVLPQDEALTDAYFRDLPRGVPLRSLSGADARPAAEPASRS